MTLISRVRLDARLYDFPVAVPGRKPRKGRRKRKALKDRIDEAMRRGKRVEIAWYGGRRTLVCLLSGVCLWSVSGWPPVPIRWVLVGDPSGKSRPEGNRSPPLALQPPLYGRGYRQRRCRQTFAPLPQNLGEVEPR